MKAVDSISASGGQGFLQPAASRRIFGLADRKLDRWFGKPAERLDLFLDPLFVRSVVAVTDKFANELIAVLRSDRFQSGYAIKRGDRSTDISSLPVGWYYALGN